MARQEQSVAFGTTTQMAVCLSLLNIWPEAAALVCPDKRTAVEQTRPEPQITASYFTQQFTICSEIFRK